MEQAPEHARSQRIELILQQVDSLPTLSPIATRLLRLSTAEDADINEIVRLVEADPALTSRLLSMCRKADRGVSQPITTVDRAVVLLGFDAVRSALLSVHMYELLGEAPGAVIDHPDGHEGDDAPTTLDRVGLWRHGLAVACAAEMLARQRRSDTEVRPDEAFVAGLLHDLGKIALDVILPRSYGRVARLAERRQTNIAEVERQIIGVDHHTAGKRLAEHWGLPHTLQDVMWLHNQPYASLPDLEHRPMIALVTLADAIARRMHIGWSGNFRQTGVLDALARDCEVPPAALDGVQAALHDRVEEQSRGLGLDEVVGPELRLQSIAGANRRLASMNTALEARSRLCSDQSTVLGAIASFQMHASRGVIATFGDVVQSAAGVFGAGYYAIVYQSRDEAPWQVCQHAPDGRLLRSQVLDPPAGGQTLADLADLSELRAGSVGLLPWLEDFLGDAEDIRNVRLLPLVCGGGQPAILLHDREIPRSLLRSSAMPALTGVWASAIAAAAQHDGARRLGERLAEANRVLSETQSKLTEARSMARLGELAAGAAHEMNNPLTIISGRSQLLRTRLTDEELRRSADAIHEASSRLTDLITGLHLFADPPQPSVVLTDLTDLLAQIVRDVKLERHGRNLPVTGVRLMMEGQTAPIRVDPAQIGAACKELLRNAMESRPAEIIEVRVQTDEDDGRLMIEVRDDGRGMSAHALAHAFDPFFSEKEAGRQAGLGLAKARRLVELHGGDIELESSPGKGSTARIILPAEPRAEEVSGNIAA